MLRELRGHLSESDYLEDLDEMAKAGYRLIALYEDDEIVALAGIGKALNLYYGRYMWVYELITAEGHRSKGYGKALLEHIETLARAEGCDTVALSSALFRKDAHRFYEDKMGYDKVAFTFKKDLTAS